MRTGPEKEAARTDDEVACVSCFCSDSHHMLPIPLTHSLCHLFLQRWLEQKKIAENLGGLAVLDVGAGIGALGLACALAWPVPPAFVALTDKQCLMPLLRRNVEVDQQAAADVAAAAAVVAVVAAAASAAADGNGAADEGGGGGGGQGNERARVEGGVSQVVACP